MIDRSQELEYRPGANVVHLLACGALVPEAVEASDRLLTEQVYANVINVTGPGPLYVQFQHSVRSAIAQEGGLSDFMADVIPEGDREVPIVTVVDGHPHCLAWIGSALGVPVLPLGVTGFGQSGSRADLYGEYGIDVDSIVAACQGALNL